jgi:probable addiction module antidote protein
MRKLRRFEDDLIERLKNPAHALGFLNAALEENHEATFLLALKYVARAQGGISKLSRLSKLHRVNLHRILSKTGNPELKSLASVLNALGLKLAVVSKHPSKFRRAA